MFKFVNLIYFCTILSVAQVGINTENPDPSSILDINAVDKGLLIPRVKLLDITDRATIEEPATGLLVFHMGTEGMVPGFYFWGDNRWHQINNDLKDAWLLQGNEVKETDALGTNNYRSLKFKTNNERVADFNPSGGLALGLGSLAAEEDGLAMGRDARAISAQNIAIGKGSQAAGNNSFAIGTYAEGGGSFSVAIGTEATAKETNATAIGHLSKATGKESVAIGGGAKAEKLSAVALGPYSEATAEKSFALGPNTKATAKNSFALGIGAKADVANTVVIGEVQEVGGVGITPINVGIGTKTPKARLDVHGTFKLGEKGNVVKGINAFSSTIGSSNITIPANHTEFISFQIPAANRPSSTRATIAYTLSPSSSDSVSILWVKLESTQAIRVRVRNDSGATINLNNLEMYFTITEF